MVSQIPGILAYLVHVDSWLAVGGLAILFSLFERVGTLPGTLPILALPASKLVWGAYFFLVARKASIGKLRLPIPHDFLDSRDALIIPLIKATLSTSWYWLLLIAVVQIKIGIVDFVTRYMSYPLGFLNQQGPPGYGVLALGIVYLPMAVLAALTCQRLVSAMDPSRGFRLVLRVPRAYAIMFAMLCLMGLVGFFMNTVGLILTAALPIPLAAPVIRHLLRLWAPLAQARLMGGFVFHNRPFLSP